MINILPLTNFLNFADFLNVSAIAEILRNLNLGS
jgi:hypothetical protein